MPPSPARPEGTGRGERTRGQQMKRLKHFAYDQQALPRAQTLCVGANVVYGAQTLHVGLIQHKPKHCMRGTNVVWDPSQHSTTTTTAQHAPNAPACHDDDNGSPTNTSARTLMMQHARTVNRALQATDDATQLRFRRGRAVAMPMTQHVHAANCAPSPIRQRFMCTSM
ncbi:hypothetical protein BU15DRAFT_68147 [Melanogaster broomeanus]|nr:hypothetical protein BU15DRAFT_68147 [Melanogaster broomeanus]